MPYNAPELIFMKYNEIRDVLLKADDKPQQGQKRNSGFMYYGIFEAVYINRVPLRGGKVALSTDTVKIYGSTNNMFVLCEMRLEDIEQFGIVDSPKA